MAVVARCLTAVARRPQKVQVSVPVLRAATDGVWARLTKFYGSDGFGAFFIPEIGDEVILGDLAHIYQNEMGAFATLGSLHGRIVPNRDGIPTLEDIAAAIRDDPDAAPEIDAEWFATATLVMPRPKEQISIRLDRDVLEHFRRYPRYQTRINAILRAAMEHEKKAG